MTNVCNGCENKGKPGENSCLIGSRPFAQTCVLTGEYRFSVEGPGLGSQQLKPTEVAAPTPRKMNVNSCIRKK